MINNSYLLGLYGVTTDTSSSGFGTSAPVKAKKTQPTAPWSSTTTPVKASDLVRAALGGRRLIDESNVSLDLAGASTDYRKMFALYQGLTTLGALADRASVKGIASSEATLLAKRFGDGLAEMSAYLKTASFEDVRLVQGVSKTSVKSTYALERAPTSFVTAPLHDGDPTASVKAFEGDVKFSMTVKTATGTQTVDLDLAEMGTSDRSMVNVVDYMNGKLEAAGVATRIASQRIPAEPKTFKSGTKTITLPAGPDKWALQINGGTGEALSFQAVDTSDAVYVTQGVGKTGAVSYTHLTLPTTPYV